MGKGDNIDVEALRKELETMVEWRNNLTSGMASFNDALKVAKDNVKSINFIQKQLSDSQKIIVEDRKKLNALLKKGKTYSDDEVKILKEKIEAEIAAAKIIKEHIKIAKSLNEKLIEQLNLQNAISATAGSIGKKFKSIGLDVKDAVLDFKRGHGYFVDQLKAVKKTELGMGILSSQSKAFSTTIFKASLNTNKLGVGTEELAKIQDTYSEGIGRSVALTESGYQAMAELAKGTIMGADGAAQFAASMDNFGISVQSSRDLVQETLDIAHKMGTNTAKTTKNMESSLRLAQKYHFKDGVKGALRMAAESAKFRMNMEAISGFADKLFTPEGAVDMAAQLQVLGGEWSKLADPFTLMYKARNDFEGLFKDVVNATKGVAKFNKETGEFDISGLELHRLREVANATGISFDELSTAAKEAAKSTKIKSQITGVIDPELRDFIATAAQYNEKNKKFEINIEGEAVPVDELHKFSKGNINTILKQQQNQKADLAERAKQAQTFDETWTNTVNILKSTLLPFIESLNNGLVKGLQGFQDIMTKTGFADSLLSFAKTAGELAGGIIKFVADNPIKAILGAAGLGILFEAGKWYLNGVTLGMGFNSVASGKGISGLLGSTAGNIGKGSMSMGSRMGIGAGLGLGGAALGLGRTMMDDPNSTGGKMMGVGSSALGGAGIGMMFGPIGALVGGIIGGALGAFTEYGTSSGGGKVAQDFVMRPGSGAVPFSENDTLVGAKPGGPIDKMLNNSGNGGVISNSVMEISFKPLKIEFGTLTLQSNNSKTTIDITNDPILARDLSRIIQEKVREAIGGGKLNPNPIG